MGRAPVSRWMLVCLLGLARCSSNVGGAGDGGAGDGGTASPLAMESFRQEFVAAVCENTFRCPLGRDPDVVRLQLGDVERCRWSLGRIPNYDLAELLRGVGAGRFRYDPAGARRCIDALRATCVVSFEFDEVCVGVFQGSAGRGQPCHRGADCAGDSYCATGPNGCPGTCTPRVPLGERCRADEECSLVRGTSGCVGPDGTRSDGRCRSFAVGLSAGAGQRCGSMTLADGSFFLTLCPRGYVCSPTSPREGVCEPGIAPGQSCHRGDTCADGAVCIGKQCLRRTVRTTVGESCSTAPESTEFCSRYMNLRCEGGSCQSFGTGALGSPCEPGDEDDSATCEVGLYCDRTSQRCAPHLAPGARCEYRGQCSTGECDEGTCALRLCNTGPALP